jgi:CRP/FNR family transcriptional regulator, cyclic AMP receptor protein
MERRFFEKVNPESTKKQKTGKANLLFIVQPFFNVVEFKSYSRPSRRERGNTMFTFASEETYEDGHVIIKEGTSGDWLYVVLSGAVEISKMINGKKFVIEVLKEGELFGEVGFLGGKKRTATATAIGQTTLGIVDRTALDVEFNELSSDLRNILMAMAKRFEKMVNRVIDFSSRSEVRVKKTLSLTYKDDMAFVRAYMGNISSGGLFIKTDKPLPQGEQFFLRLQLPDLPDPLRLSCEVVWARGAAEATSKEPAGMGVKFLEMTQKDGDMLKQYLSGISGR